MGVDILQSISVRDLRYSYNGLYAVDGINFNVSQGEIFGLLGPNGAGKTTTTEILVGLKKGGEGEVRVLDLDPRVDAKDLKSRIGAQLQTPALFDKLTVYELISLFASFYPHPLPIHEVIEMVGLTDKKKSLAKKLSGGQLQRLSVGLALISNGEIIFLDEPTTGLDPQSRRNLWDVIEKIKSEGRTIFLTTHYMDEAEKLCDRVAIIDKGKIIAIGTPRELIQIHFEEQALEFNIRANQIDTVKNILPPTARLELEDERATVYTKEVPETIKALLSLSDNGFELAQFTVRSATLEDVFLKLTGRRIRE